MTNSNVLLDVCQSIGDLFIRLISVLFQLFAVVWNWAELHSSPTGAALVTFFAILIFCAGFYQMLSRLRH